jgi:hypothetical protein
MSANTLTFAAFTFRGKRRALITVGTPAGSVSDTVNCRCATALVAGMVTVAV